MDQGTSGRPNGEAACHMCGEGLPSFTTAFSVLHLGLPALALRAPAPELAHLVRLASLSEDAWAASMVFVQKQPVDRVRIVLLEWKFPAQTARLDTYEIIQSGQAFVATANPEAAEPRPRAAPVGDEDSDPDMLEELTSHIRRRRQPNVVVVDQAQVQDPLNELIRLAEGDDDAVACPQEHEIEDEAESEPNDEHDEHVFEGGDWRSAACFQEETAGSSAASCCASASSCSCASH